MVDAELALLLEELRAQGYAHCRVLADGTVVGVGDLMFTRAIYIGLEEFGYDKRFCFSDGQEALRQLALLDSAESEPSNYIARRGKGSFCTHGLISTQCEDCKPSWLRP